MKLVSLQQLPDAHSDGIWTVAWAPPNPSSPQPILLTGSVDETVKTWSLNEDSLSLIRTNQGHALGVVGVAADLTGRLAASSSLDCIVRLWDIETNETKALFESPPSESWGLTFDPDGKFLAVSGGSSRTIKIWSMESLSEEVTMEIPRNAGTSESMLPPQSSSAAIAAAAAGKFVLAVAISADGRQLAASTMDGTIAIFDIFKGKMLHTLKGHCMPVRSLAYSPVDPRVLLSASDDGHVHMYDADSRSLVGAMSGHGSWALSVAISPDGKAAASGSSDRGVRLWDLGTRSCAQVLNDHQDQVWGVAFTAAAPQGDKLGGYRLVTVSDDKSIALYDYS